MNIKKYQVYRYTTSEDQKNPESTELKVSLLQNTWAFNCVCGKESHHWDML